MGAWAYCSKCHAGFDKPTAREVVKGERECHQCGHTNDLHTNKDDRLIELAERLDEATSMIDVLREELATHAEIIFNLNARVPGTLP